MELKIKKTTLLMSLYFIIMFLPGYFSNSFVQLISNFLLAAVAVFLFKVKYRLNHFTLLASIYFIFLVVMSYINKSSAANSHLIIFNCKILLLVYFIDYMLSVRKKDTINILFFILFAFVMVDFMSIVIFPNGVYQNAVTWNEWSTSYEAEWIFGNKNNRIYWYVMLTILGWMRYKVNEKSKIWSIIISALTILTMILVKSSTATIVAILVCLGVTVSIYRKNDFKASLNTQILVIICIIINLLILAGSSSFLKPIVEGIFHKDLTFTGRSVAWQRVMLLIIQKPLFGWGVTDSKTAINVLSSAAFVNVHNQMLNILWQGGIVLAMIFFAILMCIAKKIELVKKRKDRFALQMILVGLLIDMIFEVILGINATWVCLLLLYKEACDIKGYD